MPLLCPLTHLYRPAHHPLTHSNAPLLTLYPFHAFPGPCPGILILITMPIPDRVRASLQLIHYWADIYKFA